MVKSSIFKKTIKMMACVLVFSGVTNVSAQSTSQEVKLIVSGDGMTKDEATKVALRSAIEQAYGTFVSSNTELLNDNLVKDEIVTVSSGNIKEYKYLNEQELDGRYYVTLSTIVSVGKLVEYAKTKGAEAELAGATFMMDLKLKRLNAQNEEKVFQNLMTQLEKLLPLMFDYSIKVESPYVSTATDAKGLLFCPTTIIIKSNKNYTHVRHLIGETLSALYLKSEDEVKEYEKGGFEMGPIYFTNNHMNPFSEFVTKIYGSQGSFVYFRTCAFRDGWEKLIKNVLRRSFIIDDGLKKTIYAYNDKDHAFHHNMEKFVYTERFKKREWGQEINIEVCSIEKDIDLMGGMVGYYPINKYRYYAFPVNESAYMEIKGTLCYTEEDLEKISTIKVIPGPIKQ